MQYLIRKQFQSKNISDDLITSTDAQLHTLIAYVSLSQSKQENSKFAQLFNLIDTKRRTAIQDILKERNYYW